MDITNPTTPAVPPVEGGIPVQINSTAPTEAAKSVDSLGTPDHVNNSLNGNPGGLEGILNQQPDETNNIGNLAAQDAVAPPAAPISPATPPAPSEVTAPGVEVLPNPAGQAPEATLGVLDQTADQVPPPPGSPLPPTPPIGEAPAAPLTPPESTLTAPSAPAVPDLAPSSMPEPPVIDAAAPLPPQPVEAPIPAAPGVEGELTEDQIIEQMDQLYQKMEQSNLKDAENNKKLRDLWERYKQMHEKQSPESISKVA